MNLKLDLRKLTVIELLNRTAESARFEQAATLKLLEHLAEVERRKAYAGRTAPTLYTSLFDYLKRGLNYSDSQAAERVAATKLLLQAPSIKPALESGKLSLTSAAQVQRFIDRERRLSGIVHSPQQVAIAIEGKSKREVEQELFSRASPKTQAAMNERVKPILKLDAKHAEKNENTRQVQVSATVDEALIQEARSLVYTESVSELIERALTLYVQHHAKRRGKVDPRASVSAPEGEDIGGQASENMGKPADKNRNSCSTREKGNRSVKTDAKAQRAAIATRNQNPGTDRRTTDATSPCRQSSSERDVETEMGAAPESGRPEELNLALAFKRKYPASLPRPPVSIHLKRAIWTRASAQCEFKNDRGERCSATSGLEMDHRFPVSLGGANGEKNLQLLCRMHNQIKGRWVG